MSRMLKALAALVYLLILATIIVVGYRLAQGIKADHRRQARAVSRETPTVVLGPYVPRALPTPASRGRMIPTRSATAMPRPHPLSKVVGPVSFSATERRIRACESGDLVSTYDYRMHGGPSTASGAWQFLDGTWAGYGGYSRAWLAPRVVQDAYARHYFDTNGYSAWNASRHCWG